MTKKGIEFESIDYMKNSSLSENELKRLLRSAGLKPQDALRKNEPAYQQHVANKNLGDDDDLIRLWPSIRNSSSGLSLRGVVRLYWPDLRRTSPDSESTK